MPPSGGPLGARRSVRHGCQVTAGARHAGGGASQNWSALVRPAACHPCASSVRGGCCCRRRAPPAPGRARSPGPGRVPARHAQIINLSWRRPSSTRTLPRLPPRPARTRAARRRRAATRRHATAAACSAVAAVVGSAPDEADAAPSWCPANHTQFTTRMAEASAPAAAAVPVRIRRALNTPSEVARVTELVNGAYRQARRERHTLRCIPPRAQPTDAADAPPAAAERQLDDGGRASGGAAGPRGGSGCVARTQTAPWHRPCSAGDTCKDFASAPPTPTAT